MSSTQETTEPKDLFQQLETGILYANQLDMVHSRSR